LRAGRERCSGDSDRRGADQDVLDKSVHRYSLAGALPAGMLPL
jgi:hypothetical protein